MKVRWHSTMYFHVLRQDKTSLALVRLFPPFTFTYYNMHWLAMMCLLKFPRIPPFTHFTLSITSLFVLVADVDVSQTHPLSTMHALACYDLPPVVDVSKTLYLLCMLWLAMTCRLLLMFPRPFTYYACSCLL